MSVVVTAEKRPNVRWMRRCPTSARPGNTKKSKAKLQQPENISKCLVILPAVHTFLVVLGHSMSRGNKKQKKKMESRAMTDVATTREDQGYLLSMSLGEKKKKRGQRALGGRVCLLGCLFHSVGEQDTLYYCSALKTAAKKRQTGWVPLGCRHDCRCGRTGEPGEPDRDGT